MNLFVIVFAELFDDKVREGAHLLSKLFGGSVDNYYSSPRFVALIYNLHLLKKVAGE